MLSRADVSRVIEMAWEDHTPFEAIEEEYGLNEAACIRLMRDELTQSSFRMWRKRVTGRLSKHQTRSRGSANIKHRALGQGKLPSKPKNKR